MPLDERLYDLTEEERTFLKQQTGIQGDDELKAHIFQVQAEAYEVSRYIAACGSFFFFFIHSFMETPLGFMPNDIYRFIVTLAFASSVSQSELP